MIGSAFFFSIEDLRKVTLKVIKIYKSPIHVVISSESCVTLLMLSFLYKNTLDYYNHITTVLSLLLLLSILFIINIIIHKVKRLISSVANIIRLFGFSGCKQYRQIKKAVAFTLCLASYKNIYVSFV